MLNYSAILTLIYVKVDLNVVLILFLILNSSLDFQMDKLIFGCVDANFGLLVLVTSTYQ